MGNMLYTNQFQSRLRASSSSEIPALIFPATVSGVPIPSPGFFVFRGTLTTLTIDSDRKFQSRLRASSSSELRIFSI